MLMVHYKAPHREWNPAPRFEEAFKNRTFPEPETLFDDYSGRGTAAHQQEMSVRETLRMIEDVKSDRPDRASSVAFGYVFTSANSGNWSNVVGKSNGQIYHGISVAVMDKQTIGQAGAGSMDRIADNAGGDRIVRSGMYRFLTKR